MSFLFLFILLPLSSLLFSSSSFSPPLLPFLLSLLPHSQRSTQQMQLHIHSTDHLPAESTIFKNWTRPTLEEPTPAKMETLACVMMNLRADSSEKTWRESPGVQQKPSCGEQKLPMKLRLLQRVP